MQYPVSVVFDNGAELQEGEFYLNAILLSKIEVTTKPNKTAYRIGDVVDYTGLVVTATYQDDTTKIITNNCIITPQAGFIFNGETYVEILFSEGQDEKTCTLQLCETSSLLRVTIPPNKINYGIDDTLDYTGLVISMVYPDETSHNVTSICSFEPIEGSAMTSEMTSVEVSCAPSLEPVIYDLNCGYVDNGTWKYENPTNTFIDVYKVQAGHTYWLTLGNTVGTRFRCMFTTVDVSQSTSNVAGTSIINTNNPNTYASATYTPLINGYILIAKDNVGHSGLKSYLYDRNATEKTELTRFDIGLVELSYITVSNPTKLYYNVGEVLDYTGCIVTAHYSDGSSKDVTSSAIFSPTAGSPYSSTIDEVSVSYTSGTIIGTASFQIYKNEVSSIAVTSTPAKIIYSEGEIISYQGIVVTAQYTDESTAEITNLCTFNPPEGKAFNPETDTTVTISYDTLSCSFNLENVRLIVSTLPKVNYSDGEVISYAGLAVSEIWSADNSQFDVTEFCSIEPSEGILLTEATTPITVRCQPVLVPYAFDALLYIFSNRFELNKSYDYYHGDIYSVQANHKYKISLGEIHGPVFAAVFTTENITQITDSNSHDGTSIVYKTSNVQNYEEIDFTAPSDGYILIMKDWDHITGLKTYVRDYSAMQKTESATFDVYLTELSSIALSIPSKSVYGIGEELDYSGSTVTAFFTNGATEDVTLRSNFVPTSGTVYNTNIDRLKATYTLGETTATSFVQIMQAVPRSIEVTSPPSRVRYMIGDTITYKGIAVTATYDNGNTADVTDFVTFSSAEGKAFDPSTDTTVVIRLTEAGVTQSCSLNLIEGSPLLTGIAVTNNPKKMSYRYRDVTFDYTGIVVTATYDDGNTADVTSECSFSPANGQHFDYTTSLATNISYTENDIEKTCSLSFNRIKPVKGGLKVISLPIKHAYREGETLDFTGLQIKVLFEDGSNVIVNSSLIGDDRYNGEMSVCNEAGGIIESDAKFTSVIHKNIKVVYNEGGWDEVDSEDYTVTFSLTTISIDHISATTLPSKTIYNFGEEINYTGLVVTATYTDGSTGVIQAKRQRKTDTLLPTFEFKDDGYEITPEDGKYYNSFTDNTVTISYDNKTCSIGLTEAVTLQTTLRVAQEPTVNSFKYGESLNYNGLIVKTHHADGTDTEFDVTSLCDYNPAQNTLMPDSASITVDASYMPNLVPSSYDYTLGYVNGSDWILETGYFSDVYAVVQNHTYWISLGASVGSTFSAMFTTTDITTAQNTVSGTSIVNKSSPSTYANTSFTPSANGYIIITKGRFADLRTYVFDTNATKSMVTSFVLHRLGASSMTLTLASEPYMPEVEKGTAINYAGVKVEATYNDGTAAKHILTSVDDSFNFLSYEPAEGTLLQSEDTEVTVLVKSPPNLTPFAVDLHTGVIDGNIWKYQSSCEAYSDVYRVEAGHNYAIFTGDTVGNVFKAMFTPNNPVSAISNISGISIIDYSNGYFDANSNIYNVEAGYITTDGYLIITKSTDNVSRLHTYVYDVNANKTQEVSFKMNVTETIPVADVFRVVDEWWYLRKLYLYDPYRDYIDGKWQTIDYYYWGATLEDGYHIELEYTDAATKEVKTKTVDTMFPNSVSGNIMTSWDGGADWGVTVSSNSNGLNERVGDTYGFMLHIMSPGTIFYPGHFGNGWYIDEYPECFSHKFIPIIRISKQFTALKVNTFPTKLSYAFEDIIDYSGISVIAVYENAGNASIHEENDVTASCSFSVANGKKFNPETDTEVTISYTEDSTTRTCTLPLLPLALKGLKLSKAPDKTSYETGEPISYSGIKVSAVYSDDSERDRTDLCTYSPSAGSVYSPNTEAILTYTENGITKRCVFLLNAPLVPTSIDVAKMPLKTSYNINENIDYNGCIIMARYPDNTSRDVTSFVTFSPAAGTPFNNNTPVSATFAQEGVTRTCVIPLMLNPGILSRIAVTTNPTKMSYRYNENVDYSGLVVTAYFTNGNTANVTNSCTFSPAQGEELTTLQPTISYLKDGDAASCVLHFDRILPIEIVYIAPPTKVDYFRSEKIDYSGVSVYVKYANNEIIAIDKNDSRLTFYPLEGEKVYYGYQSARVTFKEDNTSIQSSFRLNYLEVLKIAVTTPPTKTVYAQSEPISYAGLVITATLSDGSTKEIGKDLCNFYKYNTISEGTPFYENDHSGSITVEYNSQKCYFTLTASTLNGLTIVSQPTKTSYKQGEIIDYSGLSVQGSYSNGMIYDITKNCSFSTSEGSAFNSSTDTTIVVSYQSLSCSFNLTPIYLSSLAITNPSEKTAYSVDEPINYSGLIATATYEDNSTEDVTSKCTFSPVSGKKFDPNTDTTVTVTYIENEITRFQTFNLSERILTEIVVTNQPVKTQYKFRENIDYSGLVITANYLDASSEEVTDDCTFSLPQDSVFHSTTDVTVTVSYASKNCSFTLNAIVVSDLTVTQLPSKVDYKYNETIDYTGLRVAAAYSDHSEYNVTGLCTITPVAGKAFNPDTDSNVSVTYNDGEVSYTQNFALNFVRLSSINVTSNPAKLNYKYGETIDYSGIVVTAVYSDNSENDVTDKCSFSPANGESFNSNTGVIVSYTEYEATKTTNFSLDAVTLSNIKVTNQPTKVHYKYGEVIDYSGLVVTAVYSDDSEDDVTDKCEFSLEAGSEFEVNTTVTVTYREGRNIQTQSFDLLHNDIIELTITTPPAKSSYKRGEAINYLGLIISASYLDGSKADVTKNCSLSISAEKAFNPSTDTTVAATYIEDGVIHRTEFALEETVLTGIAITNQPTKTSYRNGETINYDGLIVTATYSNGITKNVTKDCTFSIPSGKAFNSSTDTTITVNYEDKQISFSLNPLFFSIAVTTQPIKMDYKEGEIISYAGLVVTATHQSGAIVDVTNDCIMTPAAGSVFHPNTNVTIEYTENGETESTTLLLNSLIPTSISVTSQPIKTAYSMGEAIDYSGLVVTALYSEQSTADVTAFCSFSSDEGKAFNPVTDKTVIISYGEISTTLNLDAVYNGTANVNSGMVNIPANEYWLITGTTGTGDNGIVIGDGAIVVLSGINITTNLGIASINCQGDVTVVLAENTENTVTNSYTCYPGIYVSYGHTVTITGTGTLNVTVDDYSAAIGSGGSTSSGDASGALSRCGNIVIESGIITSNSGYIGAAIGTGASGTCGNITIIGGSVTACASSDSDSDAAAIGSGWRGTCGDITIKNTVTQVIATKSPGSPNSIGAGKYGSCGTVTIEEGANVIQN